MKKLLFSVLLAVFLGIFYLPNTAKAECALSSVNWDKQRIAVGEAVRLTVVGSGCSDVKVITKIYEADTVSDDLIKTTEAIFPSTNAPTVAQTITFSSADYALGNDAGEGSEEEIYVKASIVNMPATTVTSSQIVLAAPSAGGCQLGSAQLSVQFNSSPILGSPLHMIINGNGCANYQVSFKIYSDDFMQNYEMDSVNGKFDATGTKLDVIWAATNKNDNRPAASRLGNYNFYFWASAGASKVKSNSVKIPANSENGCVSCNNVIAPTTCVCADGFSGPRGAFSSCDPICKDHIGDALGGPSTKKYACNAGGKYACGTKADCSDAVGCTAATRAACAQIDVSLCGKAFGSSLPTPPAAGASQSYTFTVPNWLKGEPKDLVSLLDIIAMWLFNLAIPVAVGLIIWAGVLLMTAGANPANVKKGGTILKYVAIGLAIIFINKGFISLIRSILELGNS